MPQYISPSDSRYWESNPDRLAVPTGSVVGVDPNATPTPPTPPATPTPPSTPVVNRPVISSPEDFAQTQRDEATRIRNDEIASARGRVEDINRQFEGIIRDETQAGEGRAGSTRSRGARAGLLGSSFGAAQQAGTEKFNKQQQQFIQDQKTVQINAVFDKFDERANERIASERELAFATRDEQIANRDKFISEGKAIASSIGQQGISYDELDEEDRIELREQTQMTDLGLQVLINSSMPKEEQTDWQTSWRGDNLVMVGQDPKTGQLKTQTFTEEELGLPVGADKPANPEFITNEISGEVFWFDKDNMNVDDEGNLILNPIGKFQEGAGDVTRSSSSGFNIPIVSNPPIENTISFEDFIQQKSEEKQQSIANPEDFRDEYNNLVAETAEINFENEENLINQLSPLTRSVYRNPTAFQELTATRKGEVLAELESAGINSAEAIGQKREDKLRTEFTNLSKEFVKIKDSIGRVRASAQDPSPAGDLALIFNFMKVLDPASVVRESEFATASNTGGVDDRTRALYNKVVNGRRLSSSQRADFLNRAETLFQSKLKSQNNIESQFTDLADRQNLDSQNIIIDFKGGQSQQSNDGLSDDEAFEKFKQITGQ